MAGSDLSELLPEEIEAEVKLAAEISMGTEVSEQDIDNIRHLCDQVSPVAKRQFFCFFFYPSFCVCGDDVAVAIVLKQIHVGL